LIAIDTSAFVSVFLREPGYEAIQRKIAENRSLAPVSVAAEFLLLARLGRERFDWLEIFIREAGIEFDALGVGLVPHVRRAVLEFGKGSGHPAQLNFGDCLSYAFAKSRNIPLLFVGDDFAHTDITAAL